MMRQKALIHGKSTARFISYALCAPDEVLKAANWIASKQENKEKTVSSHILHTFSLEVVKWAGWLTSQNGYFLVKQF